MLKEKQYDVGIIYFNIHTPNSNFGAALHSFAFQKYLEKQGINSVIVNYQKWKYGINNREFFYHFPLIFFIAIAAGIKKIKFFLFFNKNCNVTKNVYTPKNIQELQTINRYCCETDVTWATFSGSYDRAFMCDYPNMKGKDNIAYSVDFGSKEISVENQKKLFEYAKNFKYISFRNIFKIDYIKNIIKRDDACIILDPTLLLKEDDYLPIVKNPKIKGEYVLVYNCKENHPDMVLQAEKFAKKKNLNLKIINCYDKNNKKYFDGIPTLMGIEEFLGYIKNCRYFFTNSYHGVCFAIIFKKLFFAYSRIVNNEKILTITQMFGLENRFVSNDILPDENIDYDKVYQKLEIMRRHAEKWLKNAFKRN